MPPQKNHKMRKIIFPQKKNFRRPGIYPTSPSYSLTLTFIEATIFTVFNFNSGKTCPEFLNRQNLNFEKGGNQVEATSPTQDHRPKARFETTMTW